MRSTFDDCVHCGHVPSARVYVCVYVCALAEDAFTMREAAPTLLGLLQGHDDNIDAAAFSPTGSVVVTGSEDTAVRVWSSGATVHASFA